MKSSKILEIIPQTIVRLIIILIFSVVTMGLSFFGLSATSMAAECIPVAGMGTATTNSFSAVTPGSNSVWVRIQSAYPTAINLNVEATPSSGAPTCFAIKSPNPTSSTIWTWVKAGTFNATAGGNRVELFGVDAGVRVDRVIIFPASSSCVPSNARVTTGTTSEPGDNCIPISSPPPPSPDTVKPVGPSSLTAIAQSNSQINLSWPVATDSVGIKNYEIYRNDSLVSTSTTTTFADTGLSSGTTYNYKVVAVDSANNRSTGAIKSATTKSPPADSIAPSPPTNITDRIFFDLLRGYYVQLDWKPSTDNISIKDYIVKKNGVVIGTTTETSYQDFDIKPDQYFTYSVQARDNAGNTSGEGTDTIVARCSFVFCWEG